MGAQLGGMCQRGFVIIAPTNFEHFTFTFQFQLVQIVNQTKTNLPKELLYQYFPLFCVQRKPKLKKTKKPKTYWSSIPRTNFKTKLQDFVNLYLILLVVESISHSSCSFVKKKLLNNKFCKLRIIFDTVTASTVNRSILFNNSIENCYSICNVEVK